MLQGSMGGERIQVSEPNKSYAHAATYTPTTAAPPNGMQYTTATNSNNAPTSADAQQRQQKQQQQQHHQHAQQQLDYQTQMMNAAAVMNSGVMNTPTCLVCYNANVNVLLEPCHHQFHYNCIERWVTRDKVCPVCWIPIQAHRALMTSAQHYAQAAAAAAAASGNYKAMMDARAAMAGQVMNHSIANNTMSNAPTNVASAPSAVSNNANDLPNPANMRKGKWTAEESAYCDRLIEEFKKGNLPLAEGTTLRTFLSKLLNCDPMRISKKYTGDQCIGKIIFRRREDELSTEDMELIRRDLAELEKTYLEREHYNQRRREKRLESELSRDKGRFLATRQMNFASGAMPAPPRPIAQYPQPMPPPVPVPIHQQTMMPMTQQHADQPSMQMPPQQLGQQQHAQQHPQLGQRGPPHNSANAAAIAQQLQPPHHHPALRPHPIHPVPHHPQQQQQQQQSQPSQSQQPPSQRPVAYNPNDHADANTNKPPPVPVKVEAHPDGANNPLKIETTSENAEGTKEDPRSTKSEGSDQSTDAFPRVSSIDSFSCLFPRVASMDNLQFNGSTGYSDPSSGMVSKSASIGDGLNAYFPRVHSLEQLSNLLQEHAPPSPPKNEKDSDKEATADSAKTSPEEATTKKLSPNNCGQSTKAVETANQIQAPKPLSKMPRNSSGIFPRVPSMDKLPRVPSLDKLPRIPSMDKLPPVPPMDNKIPRVPSTDKLPRVPSMDKLSRVSSSSDMLSRFGSSDQLSSFPSFTNLASLSSCGSFSNLSSLATNSGPGAIKTGFPRNSSIEDILSLVASSESSMGLSNSASHLQLSALAAAAESESNNSAASMATSDDETDVNKKRRLEKEEGSVKKNKVST